MKKTKLFLFSIFTFINLICGVNFATAQTISVEAESGTFNRGAAIGACTSCSGGSHARNLGTASTSPNKYFINTVTVPTAGTYTMDLYAASSGPRSIFVGVNGGIGTEVLVDGTSFSTHSIYPLTVTLAEGTNTIKFYNEISFAPNVDKFDLTLLSATPCTDCYGPFEAEAGVVNAPATIGSCSTCSGGQHVTDMGFSDRFFTYTLPNITTAGTYRLYLSYISGSDRSLTVTVNGTTDYTTIYNSVDWNVVYVKEIDIVLPAGVNTLKFHNTTSDWAPNVDKFRLQYLAATSIGSVTQAQCGGTYTWPVNNVTYSTSTTQTVVSGNNVATLNLTITPPTTNGSVTHVQTGGNYFWAANGQTYTSSGTYTHVVGCNTATLNLTLLPAETCSGCYGPFEAEDATLNRGAAVQNCSSCSGGKHVGNLGGSAASFPNSYFASTVTVPVAGTYTMSLYASAADTRSIFVGVNGLSETEVVVNSGDWTTPSMYQIVVTLAQGTNSIEFYNDNSFAPNIDKFNLTLLSAITCTDCYGPFEAESGVITAPATVGNCSTCSGGQHVTDLGFSDRFFNYTLPNISTAGTYRLYLSYISGTDRSLTVTVNGTTDYTAVYNSIDWNVVSVKEIDVVLPAGVNTLKFHNTTSDWAPNVDKFRLELIATTNIGSVTQTQCGGTYTWPVNNVTYSVSTTETVISGNNIATLNLTINTPTTNGSVTHVQTGGNYFWAANGQTYTTSGVYTHVVDCNTATLDLTLLPVVNCADCYGPFEAENGVIFAPAQISNCDNCSGGKHVTDMGFSDRYFTYDVNVSKPGTYKMFISYISGEPRDLTVTVNGNSNVSSTLNSPNWNTIDVKEIEITLLSGLNTLKFHNPGNWAPNIDKFSLELETQIPDTFAPFCKGATVATATGSSTMKFYASQTSLTALLSTTVLANAKTLWVSEVINSIESPRESRLITVTNLPSTPASMVTTDAVLCKHIGTTNEVTYTLATPTVPVSSYAWTLPSGVNAIGATNGISITVNFLGANTSVGVIGTISARALTSVETGSCASAPRSLVLSSKLPTAPTSLTLTSEDSTPHFNVITTPAVIGVSPAIYSTVGLNYLTKITKVGPYMGTSTVFTLTAPPAPTAASYAWTLPAGVNQLSGGNGNVITIDFAGVTPGIGSLPIVVKSVGGCGQSSARTLTLARALPTAPTALVVTDDAISTTTAITKVSAYTGKTTPLTLKATPAMVQGATATSYAWILPAGVNIVNPETTTPTTVQQSVNTGNFTPEGAPIFEIQNFAAISTGTVSTITVNFAGVVPGTLSFPLTVFAVNGTGNSKARTRTVTAAAPTSPAITAVSGTTFNSCTPETYTVVQTLGTSYAWTIPAGATASSLTGNTIVVDYTNVVASVGATVQVTCTASNGTGSSTAKALNVKRVLCPVRLSGSSASTFSAKAYPNPSSSEFTIETSAKGAMSVKVYDMQGRLVEKADTNRVGSKLAAGTYNVIVNQGANTKSVRVIKN